MLLLIYLHQRTEGKTCTVSIRLVSMTNMQLRIGATSKWIHILSRNPMRCDSIHKLFIKWKILLRTFILACLELSRWSLDFFNNYFWFEERVGVGAERMKKQTNTRTKDRFIKFQMPCMCILFIYKLYLFAGCVCVCVLFLIINYERKFKCTNRCDDLEFSF